MDVINKSLKVNVKKSMLPILVRRREDSPEVVVEEEEEEGEE